MSVSSAYAELGGGLAWLGGASTSRPLDVDLASVREAELIEATAPAAPTASVPESTCSPHMFDPVSGWCGCGVRDDGATAFGSPAWRARIEKEMPGGAQ